MGWRIGDLVLIGMFQVVSEFSSLEHLFLSEQLFVSVLTLGYMALLEFSQETCLNLAEVVNWA